MEELVEITLFCWAFKITTQKITYHLQDKWASQINYIMRKILLSFPNWSTLFTQLIGLFWISFCISFHTNTRKSFMKIDEYELIFSCSVLFPSTNIKPIALATISVPDLIPTPILQIFFPLLTLSLSYHCLSWHNPISLLFSWYLKLPSHLLILLTQHLQPTCIQPIPPPTSFSLSFPW